MSYYQHQVSILYIDRVRLIFPQLAYYFEAS